ncbi:MAG: hypothetical protein V1821_03495 [bacterium]
MLKIWCAALVAAVLLLLRSAPAEACCSPCAAGPFKLEAKDRPTLANSGDSLFQQDLCPPASGPNEKFFLVYRGGEGDTQENLGLIFENKDERVLVDFREPIVGNIGYFNVIRGNFDALYYGLTLIDFKSEGVYHTLIFKSQGSTFTMLPSKKTQIPVPRSLPEID